MAEGAVVARPVDRRIYEEEIAPWLPPVVFDAHVHVSLPENEGTLSPERKQEMWAAEVAVSQTWDELRANYAAMFPDREVRSLAFGNPYREAATELDNAYVLAGCRDTDSFALAVTRPQWPGDAIAEMMSEGFVGIKPYPDLAPCGAANASVYDFVPRSQLAVLDSLGGVMMLHLPRPGRLADSDNIREVMGIRRDYPSIRMILAHVGRAYCLPTAMAGLPYLADDAGLYFDISANLNADVFEYALKTVGPERLLFGSDLPITKMRGVREHVDDRYINYTDGPYSWNTNRKSPEQEADYTFYLYEELRALIAAVGRAGMGKAELDQMLYGNAAELLGRPS